MLGGFFLMDFTDNSIRGALLDIGFSHNLGTRGGVETLSVGPPSDDGPEGVGDGRTVSGLVSDNRQSTPTPDPSDSTPPRLSSPSRAGHPNGPPLVSQRAGPHQTQQGSQPRILGRRRHAPPRTQPARHTNSPNTRHSNGKKTKANMKVASLNMRGRFHNGIDKWLHINQMVRDDKIAILALQETHLNQDQTESINNMFQDSLHVIASADPENQASKGVALVINKRLLGARDIDHYELCPGRALLISIPWHLQERINVLNIYTPNDPTSNAALWERIHDDIVNLPQPDVILGDFNFVEDPLDRLPAHFDNPSTIDNWQSLKSHLSLTDGW